METFIYLRTHLNFDSKSGKNIFRKKNYVQYFMWTKCKNK